MDLIKHLLSRHYDPSRYQTTWLDEVQGLITFPLYDLGKRLQGCQQYRPSSMDKKSHSRETSRYYMDRRAQTFGVFGLETLKPDNHIVFIQEGIFQTAMLHSLNLPAIGIMGASNVHPIHELRLAGYTTLSLADGDLAGESVGKMCNGYYQLANGTDINDYDLEEVYDMAYDLMSRY